MIGIVNYGLGNLRSVIGALEYLNFPAAITADPVELARCDKLILPGVGAFGDGMKNLRAAGLDERLGELVLHQKKPILGICLGFQLMARRSSEFGEHAGLGWIDADVERLEAGRHGLRVPHVGWNDLLQVQASPLFAGIPDNALFYYVHSFQMNCKREADVVGACVYGERFTAVIQHENIYGTQFHPEKSQEWGLALLRNFAEL